MQPVSPAEFEGYVADALDAPAGDRPVHPDRRRVVVAEQQDASARVADDDPGGGAVREDAQSR